MDFLINWLKKYPLSSKFLKLSNEAPAGLKKIICFLNFWLLISKNIDLRISCRFLKLFTLNLFFKIFKNFLRCDPKIKTFKFLHFIFDSLNLSPFLGIPPTIQ